jgi:hypothetical protein
MEDNRMTSEFENLTALILREIATLHQADVAKTCAIAIETYLRTEGGENVDWKKINAAIVNRWSPSGRERVLTMAWKIVESAASNANR